MKNPRRSAKLYTFIFLLALPFIGGCEKKLPTIGQKEISYWGLFELGEVMQPLIDEFQSKNSGVKVSYEKQSFDSLSQYKNTLLTRLKQGSGPCIARVHQSWVKDFAEELEPVPASFDCENTFYPAAQESSRVGSAYFAVPLMYDGLALFYNPKLFSEAKIEKPPTTWDEFRAMAVKLTKKEEGKAMTQAGAAIGNASNVLHASDILGLMWAQTGVKVPDDLATQAAIDALTFYTNFYRKDKVWDSSLPNSIQAFAEGKVGMIFAPSWRVFDISGINPSLEFKIAAVPQVPQLGDEEVTNVNWSSFWMEAVSKDCSAKKQAWDFLAYLTSQDGQRKFYDEAAKGRPFGEPYARVDLAEALKDDKYLGPILAGAGSASSSKIAAGAGNDEVVNAVTTAIEGVLKGQSETEALQTLKQTLQSL